MPDETPAPVQHQADEAFNIVTARLTTCIAQHTSRYALGTTCRPCDLSSVFPVVQSALAAASSASFRVVHFSVQRDHVHMLVEADAPSGLTRGMQGLAIRVARAVNRFLGRRGKFWADRFHARTLRTPREVRHALVYVLQNFRKHDVGARGIDPHSSARWFTGWAVAMRPSAEPSPTAPAQTWLARVGWRRFGLVRFDESPRPRERSRSPAARRH